MELLKYVIIALLGGLAVSASVDGKRKRGNNELPKNDNTEVARIPKPMRMNHPDYYQVKAGEQLSCELYETQCGDGCCPFADGVCCSDGYECCRHGQVCIPYIGICLGIQSQSNGNVTLDSQKTTAVKTTKSCPSGTTTCPTGCCPFPNAVCCSDGEHCCPNGFTCTDSGCAANGSTNPFLLGRISLPAQNAQVNVPVIYNSNRMLANVYPSPIMPLKTCPDGKRQCPQGSSCCISDNGGWNCCPSPPMSVTAVGRLQDDNCCTTYLGWTCCLFLKCHYLGCFPW